MTLSEYRSLQVGDVVYYVRVRWQTRTIEPMRVAEINKIPFQSVWLSNGENDNLLRLEFDLCFLNLDEASKRLKELINNHDKKRRKNYDLAPKNAKQKYVYALTTITI